MYLQKLWTFGIRNNENEIIDMSHEVRVLFDKFEEQQRWGALARSGQS